MRTSLLLNNKKSKERFTIMPESDTRVSTTDFQKLVSPLNDIYRITRVEPYCPRELKGERVGWGLYAQPLDEAQKLTPFNIVLDADIGWVIPQSGDLFVSQKLESWFGKRLGASVIKQN